VEGVANLSAYANAAHTIKFEVITNSSFNSNFFLDDISFSGSASTSPNVILPEGVELDDVGKARSMK